MPNTTVNLTNKSGNIWHFTRRMTRLTGRRITRRGNGEWVGGEKNTSMMEEEMDKCLHWD